MWLPTDAAYGSPEAAREAAEQFASENRDLHRELLALRRRFEVRKNSRSGIPGVTRYDGHDTHGPYWLAYWNESGGRRTSRRFSIGRLGEAEARELAVKAREKGVRRFGSSMNKSWILWGLSPRHLKPRRWGAAVAREALRPPTAFFAGALMTGMGRKRTLA